jgi:protein-S-isoprenylcysteine O-methyltransferase Ste14
VSADLWLLLSLYALFFVPVALRARREATPRGEIYALLRRPWLSPPGVQAQLVGGLLIAIGIAAAEVWGEVGPAGSPRALLGSAVLLGAAALGLWSLLHLRSWRFLPVLAEGHELCTTGPYALIRHPIYASIDLIALGSALWVPHPSVLAGAALLLVGGDLRARSEEAALIAQFGERYRAYARRVRRLIPGLY